MPSTTRTVIPKGPSSWNIKGNTYLVCKDDGGKHACDIQEKIPSIDPSGELVNAFSNVFSFPIVDNVFVSKKTNFIAGSEGDTSKYSLVTKTHCEIRSIQGGKEELACADPQYFTNSIQSLSMDGLIKDLKEVP